LGDSEQQVLKLADLEITRLKREAADSEAVNQQLVAQLKRKIAKLKAQNEDLARERASQKQMIAILRRARFTEVAAKLEQQYEDQEAEYDREAERIRADMEQVKQSAIEHHEPASQYPPMHMTSDHRVAGSSPAGCKTSSRAYSQAIEARNRPRQ
jgi:hypothetical protein